MNKTYDELCQENQMLREGIRQMTTALANRGWADLLTTDGDLGELEIATLQLIQEGQTKDARVQAATLAVEKARTQGQRLAQRLQETSDMLSEALTLGEEASNRCQELQAENDRLRERA